MKKIILIVVIIWLFIGCGRGTTIDISNSSQYKHMIGKKYTTLKEVYIYGDTDGAPSYALNYYYLHTQNIGGRHVLFKKIFRIGHMFTIIQVKKQSFCCFVSSRINYYIKVSSTDKFSDAPVELNYSLTSIKNNISIPSPSYFQELYE